MNSSRLFGRGRPIKGGRLSNLKKLEQDFKRILTTSTKQLDPSEIRKKFSI
jgi:hypothetical protein